MELDTLLEIIVLFFIILEIYSLAHHVKLEHKVEEHMELLDKHIKQLDEHIVMLNRPSNKQNPERTDKDKKYNVEKFV